MLYHKKKTPVNTEVFILNSDPGGILTPDRWSRNPVLYTAELRSLFARRSAEILTGQLSYGAFCSWIS